MSELGPDDADALDLETRELCPDGACTGVVGADGRCRVCGKLGEAPFRGPTVNLTLTPAPVPLPGPDVDFRPLDSTTLESDGDFDTERQLCPDGACVGLIGFDGRCKVCGRA